MKNDIKDSFQQILVDQETGKLVWLQANDKLMMRLQSLYIDNSEGKGRGCLPMKPLMQEM